MPKEYILETTVRFADVDRDQVMALPALFQLLQEAAIRHADLHGVGAEGLAERGTSWVLNRLAVGIARFPRREEKVRVETWSTGVRGFRGYREFRLFAGDEPLLAASSLWLWIDLRNRMLTRVPDGLAEQFPVGGAGRPPHRDGIDRMKFTAPASNAVAVPVSVPFSDCDANGHVNNTAFFDYLQTALVRLGGPVHPQRVELVFQREILPETASVDVRLERRDDGVLVAIGGADGDYALGTVA